MIVDRYSHWPVVFRSENSDNVTKDLIKHFGEMFSTYRIPEEIANWQ